MLSEELIGDRSVDQRSEKELVESLHVCHCFEDLLVGPFPDESIGHDDRRCEMG